MMSTLAGPGTNAVDMHDDAAEEEEEEETFVPALSYAEREAEERRHERSKSAAAQAQTSTPAAIPSNDSTQHARSMSQSAPVQ